MMNKITTTFAAALILFASHQEGHAQHPLSQATQVEIGLGVATPFLQGGQELMRAQGLREANRSYFGNADGQHRDVGSYPALLGFSFNIAFYKPLQRIDGLMLGAGMRSSQTGSQPSGGGYAEGYFFNSLSAGLAAKYYPIETGNVFLKGDIGLGSVLTKNRFLDDEGEQSYFHQFGIGLTGSVSAGYSLTPFGNPLAALDLQVVYQQASTRVEVDGTGNDLWSFGMLHFVMSKNF